MPDKVSLAGRIKEQLPAEIVGFLREAGETAQRKKQNLYLVGGIVRDLILERDNLDIDLVVEGDAIELARELARLKQGKVTTHPRFGTAKLKWDNWSIDVATARSETYARPGALPVVKPGAVQADLSRRDFTINAMAVELSSKKFGTLLDPFGGRDDIDRELIRVLHSKSFIDDATRIWRGVRYEQRLDFKLEPATLKLLKQDIDRLDTISGDRIRHELELVLKEALPEKALRRAFNLGVLIKIHPSLKADAWLGRKFAQARRLTRTELPPPSLYLALLAYRLSADVTGQIISYLRLPKLTAQVLRDTLKIKEHIKELSVSRLAPSRICAILHDYDALALTANLVGSESVMAAEHIELYLNVLRYVKTALTGKDLKKMGIPEGPQMKEILHSLREARLDGKVKTRKEEEDMVGRMITLSS